MSLKKKFWLSLSLAPDPNHFSGPYFLYLLKEPYNPIYTVQFRTGINAHLFSILKDNVQTMSDEDHVCCLMFDKMPIREHLHFNQRIDCI